MLASLASQTRAAFSAMAFSVVSRSVGELAITPRISLVALCCSSASSRSRLSCSFSRRSFSLSSLRDGRRALDCVFLILLILFAIFGCRFPRLAHRQNRFKVTTLRVRVDADLVYLDCGLLIPVHCT